MMQTRDGRRRIVIFCGRFHHPSSVEHIEAIADAFPDWELTLLHEVPPRGWRTVARSALRNWTREPLSYPIRIFIEQHERWWGRHRRARRSGALAGSLGEIARPNLQYIRVAGLHRKGTLRLVADLRPWLGISIGA